MIIRIIRFFKTGLWEIRLINSRPLTAFFVRYLRIIFLASRSFLRDHCHKNATVLTYYSLLNIVPVIAVAFAIAKGFGLEKLIENQILHIAEEAHWQADLTNQILSFSHKLLEQVKGGLIAGIGVILLFWTVISILGKIEESLNDIWEIKKARTLIRKFTDYISMMVITPMLLIISSSATVLAVSQLTVIINKIALLGIFSQMILLLLNLLPYVSIWALLTMLYLIMPNTKVPIRSGILGGICAGTLYQIIQWVYIKFQIGIASYGAIYGSFAALPLFLAWLQMSWMTVLFGAEIAYANDHYETFGFRPDYSRISFASKRLLVLRLFHLLVKRFSLGEKPLGVKQIAGTLEIPVRFVRQLLQELIDVGLVVEAVKGGKGEITFLPARTVENITLKSVLDEYEKYGMIEIPENQSKEAKRLSRYLKNISESVGKYPSNIRLKRI